MLAVQLDDRAVFLKRWRDTLLRLLDDAYVRGRPARRVARDLARGWSEHASVNDAGYRIVRAFRSAVQAEIYGGLIGAAVARYPQAKFKPSARFEASLWQVITTHPPHLLLPQYKNWDEQLLAALDRALSELQQECGQGERALTKCTWGARNTLQMEHPLASALPFLGSLLRMPRDPLPGDSDMPRVQGQAFGASERFAVSPGREAEGYLHMPGGQSGHPLSPYFGAGHAAWVKGEPTPFLPGKTQHQLLLRPLSQTAQ
ncbi:MAG: penicillin acylase family protein [Candidatus Obscuribacterales bacterium]|nr:penicillin acylase family protein [Steroidobacteraceae bacterium]